MASLNLTPAESGRGPAVEEPLFSDTSEEFSRLLPTSLQEKWPVHHVSMLTLKRDRGPGGKYTDMQCHVFLCSQMYAFRLLILQFLFHAC